MSEKREGWLGWERLGCGITRADEVPPPINDDVEYSWVQPLDPDGPKPGETWEDMKGRVTLIGPRSMDSGGAVETWWAETQNESIVTVPNNVLRPTPRTRTVTVELTEEDVAKVKRFANGPSPQDFLRKLAEALEDS